MSDPSLPVVPREEAVGHVQMAFAHGRAALPTFRMDHVMFLKMAVAYAVLTAFLSLPLALVFAAVALTILNVPSSAGDKALLPAVVVGAIPQVYVLWFIIPPRLMRLRMKVAVWPIEYVITNEHITRHEFDAACARSSPHDTEWMVYGLRRLLRSRCRR